MPACRYQDHPDELSRLLFGDVLEAEQTRLTAHLETCPDCRRTLDTLAARSGLWSDLSLLRDPESDPPTQDVSQDLKLEPRDDEEVPLGLLESTEEPGQLGKLGPYDILRVIGRGGMGVVFLARDRALERRVAIKILTPGMAATGAARRRFAREAKAAAAVAHEHVVTIHAVDITSQGIPYLVMQYIPGKSVQDLIDQGRQPELREILRIGSQAASGLAAAHSQGLIHRDIKPANILLENGVERVKITDFGLARAVDDATMTQSGVVAGTPQYMSPEQARGDAIDHRTDLFSLGSVLYALCTGRAPFRGNSSMATLKRVCEKAPEAIGSLNPEIPAWLIKIITRLHAKDPGERYATAEEVAELLGRCLAHVQQPASVPLPAELITRPKARRFAALVTLSLGLLLATSLSLANVRAAAQHAADYVATVLRLKTPEGVLVVETDDPGIGIKLDGSELVVTGAGVKELRLSVGSHNVQALKDGKVLREELVTITRGGRSVLTIRREPDDQPPATAARIDRPESPRSLRVGEMEDRPAGRFTRSPRGGPAGSETTAIFTPSARRRPGDIVPVPPRPLVEFKASDAEVRSVAFWPEPGALAYGAKDGRIVLWDWIPRIGSSPTSVLAHPGGVECVAFSPDGKTLATGGWDHHVKLWDLVSERPSPKLVWDFSGYSDGVRSVAFSPGGEHLAAGGFDRILTVLEAKTGLRLWTSPPLDQPINGVQFSPDGRTLALALGNYSKGVPGNPVGQPGEVQLWSWPERKLVATMRGWTRECKTVAFSPDGKSLAATSGDGTTRLYDVSSHTEKAILQSGPFTAGVAFRPDGKLLATSNWSGEVIFWDPLKSNYQQNSSDVIGLITKARKDLSDELQSLEKAHLEYRQKNPAYSADSTGQSFVARRLDQWDQILNQFSARSLQLQSQLELGKKMSRDDVDPTSIASALTQVGMLGGNPPMGSTGATSPGTNVSTNDASYIGIARELVEVESRRKMAEVFLAHFQREHQDAGAAKEVSDHEIETRFLEDPAVAELKFKLGKVYEQLADARRIARSDSDHAVRHYSQVVDDLKQQYQRLWEEKRPLIVQSLAIESNPEVRAGYRAAQAELIGLKARESALRDRLDQVATEELQKLRLQHEKLRRQHGESHPLLAQLKQRIAGIEARQKQSADSPGGGNIGALIDYMTQSLESIEALRGDLQKKFEEDLSLSKKAEITLLEESNLRSNLERQRALLNSVVDQLKQAKLVSSLAGYRAAFQAHHANIPCLAFTPDGRILATAGADGSIKLWDASDEAIARFARVQKHEPAQEALRLAEVLKSHPPRHSSTEGINMQVYMRDLIGGGITLIADEPVPGLSRTSSPNWSNDGRRIAFHASPPNNDWGRSQMMILEARDGKPSFRSLGTGNCPAYSPDDQRIAFLLWGDGVWLMNADGTERRRVGNHGAPFWSPQGDQLMINDFSEPTECRLLNLETGKQQTVQVPGHHLISWPRWVSQETIVAVISTGQNDEAVVLLDVSTPARAKVVRVLWKRGPELDVLPRWPLYRPSTGQFLFVGVEEPNARNLYEQSPGEGRQAVPMQPVAREDQHEGLFLSPGGRYLLFNANRPERR